MSKPETDEDLAKKLATTPPVKQMDNLGAAVETAEKKERTPGRKAEDQAEKDDREHGAE